MKQISLSGRHNDPGSLTEGVIWQQLLMFFFPILMGSFFQQLYNTADAIVVGKFIGTGALASVGGATGTLINLLVGFFNGLASGATVIAAQYWGARRDKDMGKAVHTAIALSLVCGVVLMGVGIVFSPVFLVWLQVPEDILDSAVTYIRIYFIGMIPSLIYNIGSGLLRATGDTRRPMLFLIISCITNIIMDILLVVGCEAGVAGAAWATIISQAVSAVLVLFTLMRSHASYRLVVRQIRFSRDHLQRIVRIGLPAAFNGVLYSISNLLIQSRINTFGTPTVAAWTAYGKLDGLFWMIANAFGVAVTTFVGQNFGAGKLDRVKKGVRVCMLMASAATVILSLLILLVGQYAIRLFTESAEVTAIGVSIIHTIAPLWFTYLGIEVLSGAVRGSGDSLIPTLMTLFGVCVLRLLWIYAIAPLNGTLTFMLLCYPITWAVTSVAFIIYYRRGRWIRRNMPSMSSPE